MIVPNNAPEPAILRAGDSWTWNRAFEDFQPADGWVLAYTLNCASAIFGFPGANIAPSADQQSWDVSIPAAKTAACIASSGYTLYALLSNAATGENVTLPIRKVQVLPAILGATAPVDTRSHNEIVLDNIRLALEGCDRPDVIEYSIHGRMLKSYDRLQLEKMKALYAYRVRREKIERGEIVDQRRIGVVFRNPGSF